MADPGRETADDVVIIGTQDGSWYGIPREIVERHRLSADEATRVQAGLDGADREVQAFMFHAAPVGLNLGGILGGGSPPPSTGPIVGTPGSPPGFQTSPISGPADFMSPTGDDGGV